MFVKGRGNIDRHARVSGMQHDTDLASFGAGTENALYPV